MNKAKEKVAGEPAVGIGLVASVLVALAAKYDIVISVDDTSALIVAVIPFLTGVLTRFKVKPA